MCSCNRISVVHVELLQQRFRGIIYSRQRGLADISRKFHKLPPL